MEYFKHVVRHLWGRQIPITLIYNARKNKWKKIGREKKVLVINYVPMVQYLKYPCVYKSSLENIQNLKDCQPSEWRQKWLTPGSRHFQWQVTVVSGFSGRAVSDNTTSQAEHCYERVNACPTVTKSINVLVTTKSSCRVNF